MGCVGDKINPGFKIIVNSIQSSASPVYGGELNFGELENVTHGE